MQQITERRGEQKALNKDWYSKKWDMVTAFDYDYCIATNASLAFRFAVFVITLQYGKHPTVTRKVPVHNLQKIATYAPDAAYRELLYYLHVRWGIREQLGPYQKNAFNAPLKSNV